MNNRTYLPMGHEHTLLSTERHLFPSKSSYLSIRRLRERQGDMRFYPGSSVRNKPGQEVGSFVLRIDGMHQNRATVDIKI